MTMEKDGIVKIVPIDLVGIYENIGWKIVKETKKTSKIVEKKLEVEKENE